MIDLGLWACLLGVGFTYREVRFRPGIGKWAERLLLLIPALGILAAFVIPFITWTFPVGSLYGLPLLWELPHELSRAIGVVWLGLPVWVATKGSPRTKPITAVAEASEGALPNWQQVIPGQNNDEDINWPRRVKTRS